MAQDSAGARAGNGATEREPAGRRPQRRRLRTVSNRPCSGEPLVLLTTLVVLPEPVEGRGDGHSVAADGGDEAELALLRSPSYSYHKSLIDPDDELQQPRCCRAAAELFLVRVPGCMVRMGGAVAGIIIAAIGFFFFFFFFASSAYC